MDSSETTPQWYAAILVYESSSTAAGYEPMYEETTMLIQAISGGQATDRAREFAKARAPEYVNEYGETIKWSLKHVVDVSPIADPIGDGAEIYTRHFRNYEAYRVFELLDLS